MPYTLLPPPSLTHLLPDQPLHPHLPACTPAPPHPPQVAELFVFNNFMREPVEEVKAGDIAAFSGVPDIKVGGAARGGGVGGGRVGGGGY